MKCVLWILFLLKVLVSAQTTELLDDYDITEALNDTIAGIFQTVDPKKLDELINSVMNVDKDDNEDTTPYKYDIRVDAVPAKVFRIRIINVSYDMNLHVHYGFNNSKLQLHLPVFIVNLTGIIKPPYLQKYDFQTEMHFERCTISAIRQSNSSDRPFLIDLQYYSVSIVKLPGEFTGLWSFIHSQFKYSILPSIIKLHMSRNERLSNAFDAIYDTLTIKNVITKHPYLSGRENLGQFILPNVSFGCYNLRNIVEGLTNFHSLNFTIKLDTITYTLLMREIRGKMIIDELAGSRIPTSVLEYNYFIDSLSITVTQKINRTIHVEAKNYSIVSPNFNISQALLTYIESDLINEIEYAIGSSIMPSAEYQKSNRSYNFASTRNPKTTTRILLTENPTRFEENPSTKQTQNNSISFNGSTTEANSIQNKESATHIHYNYQISLHDINVHILSGNPLYPHQLQCALPTDTKFTQQINVIPNEKNNSTSNNNETNTMQVNFQFNYPPINVSMIKPNNSKGVDSCEFQIRNDQGIKVELPPSMGNTTVSNRQLEMKKKIDSTLLSITKDRIVRTLKPMICLPFDVCAQTIKMVDNFFMGIVDTVLKKCSFQRDTSTNIDQGQENDTRTIRM